MITIIPSLGVAKNPGYLFCSIAPAAAVRAGAAWRLSNDVQYSSSTAYTRSVNSTNPIVIQFKPIDGWNLPSNQTVTVLPGLPTTNVAFYTVTNPLLVSRASGFGITGTTGTSYRVEQRSSLSAGTWLPLSTNTILSTGFNLVLPRPPTNPPTTFYRLQWLP